MKHDPNAGVHLRKVEKVCHVGLEPLEHLCGGRSGARVYSVLATFPPASARHMVLKLDSARRGARTSAGMDAARVSLSPQFLAQHVLPAVVGPVRCGDVTASFYEVAGGSLARWRPLASYSQQALLRGYHRNITSALLAEFSAETFSRQHPQEALQRWVCSPTLDRAERVRRLLRQSGLDPVSEGFILPRHRIVDGTPYAETLPNPLAYLVSRELWGGARKLAMLVGRAHGDLHPGNVLVRADDLSCRDFVFIDLERYEEGTLLFLDHRTLELGLLLEHAGDTSVDDWMLLVDALAEVPSVRAAVDLPVGVSGVFELADEGRRVFLGWLREAHADKSDELTSQYLLAAVAAGLRVAATEALGERERWAGFLYAASHLGLALALLKANLPAQAMELPDSIFGAPAVRPRRQRRLTAGWLPSAALAGLAAAGALGWWGLNGYSEVAPNFQPAWAGIAHPNAYCDIRLYRIEAIPDTIDWFAYLPGGRPPLALGGGSLQALRIAPSHYVYYRSKLSGGDYAWTGLFLHRLPLLPYVGLCRWKLPEDGELLVVLHADKPDRVELGLKDEGGGERKLVLEVRPGWAGYRVPLRYFENVHMAGVDLLILAHTRAIGSASENTFRIAALVAR